MDDDSCPNVLVEYSWRPLICSKCKVFGHSTIQCEAFSAKDNEPTEGKGDHNVEIRATGKDSSENKLRSCTKKKVVRLIMYKLKGS